MPIPRERGRLSRIWEGHLQHGRKFVIYNNGAIAPGDTFRRFLPLDFMGASRSFLLGFDEIRKLDAPVIEDGRLTASNVEVVARQRRPPGERRGRRRSHVSRPARGNRGSRRTLAVANHRVAAYARAVRSPIKHLVRQRTPKRPVAEVVKPMATGAKSRVSSECRFDTAPWEQK